MATQPINGGEYYLEGQDLGHVTINEHDDRNAHTGYLVVQSRTVTDPQTLTPQAGQAWIVGSSAVNEWAGHDGEVAMYYSGWLFRQLQNGEVFTSLADGTNGAVYVNNGGTHVLLHSY